MTYDIRLDVPNLSVNVEDDINQTRIVLRQPAYVLNQSPIPIQQVAESSIFSVSSSYAAIAEVALRAISSSYAATASYVQLGGTLDVTASYAFNALSASYFDGVTQLGRLQNVFYVTEEGQDTNDGKTIGSAFRTIRRATEAVADYVASASVIPGSPPRSTIRVSPGYYTETAPIYVPANTSIMGNDLRTVVVRPTIGTKRENLFHMNNACYAYGLRLEGCEIDDLRNPRNGFFFALAPGAFIVTSPYIQNCTSAHTPVDKFYVPLDYNPADTGSQPNPEVGNGPGGMIVDDSVLDPYSPLKSMIVDAYTQVAFNGMGLVVRGAGYAQQVSFFTNFSHVGVWAIEGGHASLLNSNTTFGDYGLRAKGKRILVVPDVTQISSHSNAAHSSLILSEKDSIIDYMVQQLQLSGSYSASYLDTGSTIYASTRKDGGILVSAIVSDMLSPTPGRTVQFTQGLFKGQDISSGSVFTLPPAEGFDEGPITTFRISDIVRYSEASASRDAGYLLDAVATDILYGGNERSITSAEYFYKYPSVALTTQLQKTLEGIRYIKQEADYNLNQISSPYVGTSNDEFDIILNALEFGTGSLPSLISNITNNIKTRNVAQYFGTSPATSTEADIISASFATVTNIIINGTGSLPSIIPYTTPSSDPNILAAYDILQNNIEFIQEEMVGWLSSSWSSIDWKEDKARRDIGYIISGAAEDLLYGSNSSSVCNGTYFYLYPSPATGSLVNQTLDGINYASQLAQKLVLNTTFVTPSVDAQTAVDTLLTNKTAIQNKIIDKMNNALIYDFIRAWKYMREYIIEDPDNKFGILDFNSKQKVRDLFSIPIDTITSAVINLEPRLLQEFGSLVTSTSHDLSYAGSGVNFLALPANQGGIGKTNYDIRIFEETGGRVYHTSGDESGDFFAGNDFVIRQATGIIEGRTFTKAILATFTPLNLALENI